MITNPLHRTIALAATAALALTLSACATTVTGEKDGAHTVTYTVTGTKQASLTYTDGGTKTSQETEAAIPWTKEIKSTGNAIVYQVSAQNKVQSSKSVSCSIKVDGKVVDTNEGKGQFAIASCQYNPSEK